MFVKQAFLTTGWHANLYYGYFMLSFSALQSLGYRTSKLRFEGF
jgi:hypothetical protein